MVLDGLIDHVERICLRVGVYCFLGVLLVHILASTQLVALAIQHVLHVQLTICGLDHLENVSTVSRYAERIQEGLG